MSVPLLLKRPDSEEEIRLIAQGVLQKASVIGQLPTPVDAIVSAANVAEVTDPDEAKERFIETLSDSAKNIFLAGWQKLRGIADLRERVIYIPRNDLAPRVKFARFHEIGHEEIPWHKINREYLDDDASLSPEAKEVFEQEASFFASEVIFQGNRFQRISRDFKAEFASVFTLADRHEASRHATLRRFVEESDEALACIPYWPSKYAMDHKGNAVLRQGRLAASPAFQKRYGALALPAELRTGDPWEEARRNGALCSATISLDNLGDSVLFEWEAWWNTYSLLVLLRRRPSLSLVGRIFRSSVNGS